ncbi:hypothetical protein MCERE155_00470 [Candidatus Nanopelagicaceae bacterium]
MWDETPTSWQLRMAFPAEARALEDILISDWLHKLGLMATKVTKSKSSLFRIQLVDNYELQIAPVDKGVNGYAEWFSWHMPSHVHAGEARSEQLPESSIRAHVQLMYSDETGRSQIYSFTHHHQNVESLIRTALHSIHHDLGLKLKPQLRKRKDLRSRE